MLLFKKAFSYTANDIY